MVTLIADSGSTKTTWCLVDAEKDRPLFLKPVQTQGLNPLYASADDIADAARQVISQTGEHYPDLVQFYGAGCSGERIDVVSKALRRVFSPATRIEVASDLLAACRALYPSAGGKSSGIACILGTGAIAASYDSSTDVMTPASSLGYILGDEGSGAWFGRNVLSDYLKEQMPSRTRALFEQDFSVVSAESAIQHVYQQPFPNRYLASFATFVGLHPENSYCQQLAFNGIELFFRRNVMRLNPKPGDTVSFVGSVAYHLRNVLEQHCLLNDLVLGDVFQEPMEGLIRKR